MQELTSPVSSVAARRLELRLTQMDVAIKAGISLRTVQHIESGKHEPRGKTARALAPVLHWSIAELFEAVAS